MKNSEELIQSGHPLAGLDREIFATTDPAYECIEQEYRVASWLGLLEAMTIIGQKPIPNAYHKNTNSYFIYGLCQQVTHRQDILTIIQNVQSSRHGYDARISALERIGILNTKNLNPDFEDAYIMFTDESTQQMLSLFTSFYRHIPVIKDTLTFLSPKIDDFQNHGQLDFLLQDLRQQFDHYIGFFDQSKPI